MTEPDQDQAKDLYAEARSAVVAAALPDVAFDGWTPALLAAACEKAELDGAIATLAFPNGVADLIAAYSAVGDTAMQAHLPEPEGLKIRERITEAVWARLMADSDHREAARRAAGWLSVPGRQKQAGKLLFATADAMWHWAGDTATDYNYYSKRLILSGVIGTTRLVWFDDDSEDFAKTRAFLERRIENVMQFEKLKAKAKQAADKMHGDAAPFDGLIGALAKMRYAGGRPGR